jgi:hypothetical protein
VTGVELALRVTPRAAADRVGPYADGVLAVRVTRPPADGEANEAVMRLVARALGVPPSSVRLVGGARSRRKRCAVDGLSAAELRRRLDGLGD